MAGKPSSYIIIIPAYNPTSGLVELAREIRKLSHAPIVVIDDGSKAECRAAFEEVSTLSDIFLIRNAVNLGKGAALKNGLNYALLTFPDARQFVTADADGQHLPSDIIKVADEADDSTLTLGTRTFDKNIPIKSKFGNTVSVYVYRLATGVSLSDTQTGLRSIPRAFAERCLTIPANRYEFETAMIIAARNSRLSFKEVPIETIYVDNNRGTHFDPIRDSFRIYFVLLRYSVSSVAAVLTELLAFAALSSLGAGTISANLLALLFAMLVQFVVLRQFVFKSRSGPWALIGYVAYAIASRFVSALLQSELLSELNLSPLAVKMLVDTAIFFVNFLFLREFVFRRRGPTNESD